MGYQTDYTLSIVENKSDYSSDELIEMLRDECDNASYALNYLGETNDSCKWYSHQADIEAFSTKHPLATFILKGRGEDKDDVWRLYVKNGKSVRQTATLSFPAQEDALNDFQQ